VDVSDKVQPRGGGRDAPVGLRFQPVIPLELRFDEHMDAMECGLAVGEAYPIVHVPETVLDAQDFLHPMVEVGQHERREYLAGIHADGQALAPGRSEDELVDDVEYLAVLYLPLDKIEEDVSRDVVEVLLDVFFKIVFRSLWVVVDRFAHLHRAEVRALALLGGVCVPHARSQEDGSDNLEDDVLNDPVGEGDGVA